MNLFTGILGLITGGLLLKIHHMRFDTVYFGAHAKSHETQKYLGGGFLFGVLVPIWYIHIIVLVIVALITFKMSQG